MDKILKQVEKNVAGSFAYVKKDILMLNDSYTNMQEAITQVANSYKVLADEIRALRIELDKQNSSKKIVLPVQKKAQKVSQKTKTVPKTVATKKTAKKDKNSSKKKAVKKVIKETTVYE